MGRCENLGLLFGAASREIHDPHILVFVNNIHERPLRSLPFVTTHSPSSKLCLALACLRRRSWPITCLRCPLVFIARSPILVAFTARKDYSLCEYRSSRIVRLGSQPFVPLARLHRPIVADRSVFGTISHSSASSTVWRCVSLIHDPYIRADFSLREYYSRASSDRCRSSLLAHLHRSFVSHLLVFVTDHGRLLFSLPARLRLHRRLNFTARLSSSPGRPYSSPLPLAKTIVFANIVCLGP